MIGIEASVQPDLLVGHGRAAQVHCRNGDEALRIATVNGTHASYENALKGTITAGKLADFVQLAKDPHHVAPDTIKDIRVVRTIAGGRRRSQAVAGGRRRSQAVAGGRTTYEGQYAPLSSPD